MEPVGIVTKFISKNLNDTCYAYQCVRKPGFVYQLNLKTGNLYRCCRCRELKKDRYITIIDDMVIAERKHPEDDHHPDCEPLPEEVVAARQADRDMRLDVRTTGKYNRVILLL